MKPNYKHLCSSVDWQSFDGIVVTMAMGQLHKKDSIFASILETTSVTYYFNCFVERPQNSLSPKVDNMTTSYPAHLRLYPKRLFFT